MSAGLESFSREIAAKPASQQAAAIQVAVNAMPDEMKEAVATALGTRVSDELSSVLCPCGSVFIRGWLGMLAFAILVVTPANSPQPTMCPHGRGARP